MKISALLPALVLLATATLRAADVAADISVTFAPRQGEPVTATATAALINEGATLPLDVPNAIRIIEVSPRYDEKGSAITALIISILDPGTILPATPGVTGSGAAAAPVPPHPMVLLKTTVAFESDRDISFFKDAQGEWKIRIGNVARR